ncbi:hypothetical protein L914_14806 [Phytophthora nicotianae]|uniref:MULE transposase domain-containing protein n=1 Tax=Phytophthora nicotianae TaxID=4792 RepID=W2MRK7_PHYNI|nr:hypothetical protein L914_14806 [Phytophthora nicotianae]
MPGVDQDKLLRTVRNAVRNYRRSVLHDNDFIDEMAAFASKNRFRDAMDDTTAFAFGFDLDHKNEPILGRVEGDDPLIVGFATKSIIRRLDSSANFMLHLDATFKLNSKGYPVIVMGLSDMWRQFHHICLFLASDLKQPQWESVLRAAITIYQRISGHPPYISFVMMDADSAQRSAFKVVALQMLRMDQQPTYIMCFFHVMINLRKRVIKFTEQDKSIVYRYIYRIHMGERKWNSKLG